MEKRSITSGSAPAAVGPYSQAIEIDGWLFTSGQIGLEPSTGQLVEGLARQVERAFENLSAVLAEAGATFDDVVKTTVFLTSMSDFAEMNDIYAGNFNATFPARSTVAVKELPKGALFEIEAVALKG
ncbi:MAG: RidA family protein [Actinobacteria bacterium]|nr:RidA family protein [Actinomycetota bacterium]